MSYGVPWLQDIDCRDFTGKIFKTLGLGVDWLQAADCKWFAAIIFKRLGLAVGWFSVMSSQFSVMSFQFPVSGFRFFPYFYCSELGGGNVFLVLRG